VWNVAEGWCLCSSEGLFWVERSKSSEVVLMGDVLCVEGIMCRGDCASKELRWCCCCCCRYSMLRGFCAEGPERRWEVALVWWKEEGVGVWI
jgi:hypothetical protein